MLSFFNRSHLEPTQSNEKVLIWDVGIDAHLEISSSSFELLLRHLGFKLVRMDKQVVLPESLESLEEFYDEVSRLPGCGGIDEHNIYLITNQFKKNSEHENILMLTDLPKLFLQTSFDKLFKVIKGLFLTEEANRFFSLISAYHLSHLTAYRPVEHSLFGLYLVKTGLALHINYIHDTQTHSLNPKDELKIITECFPVLLSKANNLLEKETLLYCLFSMNNEHVNHLCDVMAYYMGHESRTVARDVLRHSLIKFIETYDERGAHNFPMMLDPVMSCFRSAADLKAHFKDGQIMRELRLLTDKFYLEPVNAKRPLL